MEDVKLTEAESTARKMVGDGQSPNKYWVTLSSEYKTNAGSREVYEFNAASEQWPDLPDLHETLGPFETFAEALRVLEESEYLPSPADEWEAYHSAVIEDRISGVLYESGWIEVYNPDARFNRYRHEWETWDDTRYTREEMERRGEVFE